jgi:hypothetical protein
MFHDWAANVKKYAPGANDAAIKGILKHLGVSLRHRDVYFVACSNKTDRDDVRDHFLKKKLGLSESNGELDRAVEEICRKMHGDRNKPRVTFYYLLAEKFDKLSMFT